MLVLPTEEDLLLVVLLSIIFYSCGQRTERKSEGKFTLGLALIDHTRGHEDLTRFAVEMANQKIKEELNISAYFTPIPSGENAARSSLPIIKGSFDTDWAVSPVLGEIVGQRLLDYYGISNLEQELDWQDIPWLQSIHFLRDRDVSGEPLPLQTSLDSSREKIIRAFLTAIQFKEQPHIAFYWLGHALHTIQDSFSTVHTQRTHDFKNIRDICLYGNEPLEGLCFHGKPFSFHGHAPILGHLYSEDRVWRSDSLSCSINEKNRSWECLKPEAQMASRVSAGFLFLYAKYSFLTTTNRNSGRNIIQVFLQRSDGWNSGFFVGEWE